MAADLPQTSASRYTGETGSSRSPQGKDLPEHHSLFTRRELEELRIESFSFSRRDLKLVRTVRTRRGKSIESPLAPTHPEAIAAGTELGSVYDGAWLRSSQKPAAPTGPANVRIVDLFSGCGGMSLGVMEAARALGRRFEAVLAADIDSAALEVYSHNLTPSLTRSEPLERLFEGSFESSLSRKEEEIREQVGAIELLVGGPPCQGHSNLNNHTRRHDGRNALFGTMARAVEVLQPEHLIVENVPGVRHSRDNVFQQVWRQLRWLGYFVSAGVLHAEQVGVAQTRPRLLLLASRTHRVSVDDLISTYGVPRRSFEWACGDLSMGAGNSIYNSPANVAGVTRERIDYLFDNDLFDLPDEQRPKCHKTRSHTYQSVYGRMRPSEPAPTITTGFMTMGQGRFVHPSERRTLTPQEGARLQFFPDWFEFGDRPRSEYVRLIGNAVPPKMAYVAALELLR